MGKPESEGRDRVTIPRRLRKPLAGLLIALCSIGAALTLSRAALFRAMEWKIYDLELRSTAQPQAASPSIVLIEIDDRSIERMAQNDFGRFPWPRDTYATLLRYLERGRPKAIAFDILFLEDDKGPEGSSRDQEFAKATERLGNVVHAVEVNDTHPYRPPLPARTGFRLNHDVEEHQSVKLPLPALAAASRMLGSTFMLLDSDGPVRRAVPFVRQGDAYYPSLGLATSMVALGLEPADVRLSGTVLELGPRRIPLYESEVEYLEKTRVRHMLVRYKGPAYRDERRTERTYRSFNFWDLVLSEAQLAEGSKPQVDPALFRDKIVIVGTTAAGLHDLFQTPFGEKGKMPGMQIHASVVDSILSGTFLRPAPSAWSLALLVGSAGLLGLLGVYLGFWPSLAATCVLGLGVALGARAALGAGVWVPVVPAATALVFAQFSSVAYKYFVEDKARRQVKALFSRYVAPAVVKELVEDPSRARLGGQRRLMTVLFSDIRSFTTLSEAGQPEEVIRQLNEYFTRMVGLLFAHHGTLDKFVGDMIMGLFNAPVADPEHADHAVEMGLAMLSELDSLNEGWRREGRPSFDIGIGINTGDMIVGNVGSEQTLSYTVIGDNVNLGSRLESLNKQYQSHIIISESTRQRLKKDYFMRPLGRVKVKGKTQEVEIFEVCRTQEELDIKLRQSREQAAAAGT